MPIYEYQCPECGHGFELIQPVSASSEQPCPACGATASRKISQSGFVLKGAGFYVNDYVRKSDGGDSGTSGGNGGDKAATTEKKTESAPAKSGDANGTS